MKTLRVGFVWVAAVLFLMALILEVSIYVANTRTRQKSEALLTAIRQLRVGESTLSSTEKLLVEFGAVSSPTSPLPGLTRATEYQISVLNRLIPLQYRHRGLWRLGLGLKPTITSAQLEYRDGTLVSVTYRVDTPVFTHTGEGVQLVALTAIEEDRGTEPRSHMRPYYELLNGRNRGKFYGVQLGAVLSPNATPDQRNAAFDFDLSCISSLRGCQAFCEIMPSVWREAKRTYETHAPPMVQELLDNPSCPQN